MIKILISTYAGVSNKGAEALVRGLSLILEEEFGKDEIDLSLSSIQPHKDRKSNLPNIRHYIYRFSTSRNNIFGKILNRIVMYLDRFGFYTLSFYLKHYDFFKAISKQDLFIEMGADNYDVEYGGFKLMYQQHNWIKKNLKTKMLLYDLSLNSNSVTPEFLNEFERFECVTVRETVSEKNLRDKYKGDKLFLVPDPAFVMPLEKVKVPDIMQKKQCVGVNLSDLILRDSYGNNRRDIALSNYYYLIDRILELTDMGIVLLPHVMKNQDLSILRIIADKYKGNNRVYLVENEDLAASQLKYIISKFRFLVTARTHASIAAYSTCVPTLVLGYSTKSIGIATDLFGNVENYVLSIKDLNKKENLWEKFEWIMKNENDIHKHLSYIMPSYQEKAKLIGTIIKKVYDDKL